MRSINQKMLIIYKDQLFLERQSMNRSNTSSSLNSLNVEFEKKNDVQSLLPEFKFSSKISQAISSITLNVLDCSHFLTKKPSYDQFYTTNEKNLTNKISLTNKSASNNELSLRHRSISNSSLVKSSSSLMPAPFKNENSAGRLTLDTPQHDWCAFRLIFVTIS